MNQNQRTDIRRLVTTVIQPALEKKFGRPTVKGKTDEFYRYYFASWRLPATSGLRFFQAAESVPKQVGTIKTGMQRNTSKSETATTTLRAHESPWIRSSMRSAGASLLRPSARIFGLLRLEEVYGALAYYLANQADIDAYLIRQSEKWAEGKRSAELLPANLLERLMRARDDLHTTRQS